MYPPCSLRVHDATKAQEILATAPRGPLRASAVKNVEQITTDPTKRSTTSTTPPPLEIDPSSDKDDDGSNMGGIDGFTSDKEDNVDVAASSSSTTVEDKSKTELPTYSSPFGARSCIIDIRNRLL